MGIDPETLLLGFIGVSVSLLLIMLMIALGDQYSRFGAVLRCALSSAILAVAAIYDLPGYLHQAYGLSVAGAGLLWVSSVVGALGLAVAAVYLFVVWLRLGEGDEPLPSAQREARDDAEGGAERKQA
jgi:hypothetical protein